MQELMNFLEVIMVGKATFYNCFTAAKRLAPIGCLFLWVSPAFSMGEVYQWTDLRGVIHLTNNLNSVPEALRESPQLIVRRDFVTRETIPDPDAQPVFSKGTSPEPDAPETISPPVSDSTKVAPTIIYNQQTTTNIVVVQSRGHRFKKRGFRVRRHFRPAFMRKFKHKRTFKGRQFIHPEEITGRRRQYIHPEAFRHSRSSLKRQFSGRRSIRTRAMTGRRR